MLLESSYSISVFTPTFISSGYSIRNFFFFVQNLHERMIDREFREWNPKNARSMDGQANRDVVVTTISI